MRDEKISDFLARLADRVPAPGGGAAAALLGMVARYSIAAATEAARAAATTARVNVEINLGGITDGQARAELAAEADKVDDIAARAEQVTAAVRKEIAR